MPTSLCNYLPVLQQLQTMKSVPLEKRIVHWPAPNGNGATASSGSSSDSGSIDSSSSSSSSDSIDSSSSSSSSSSSDDSTETFSSSSSTTAAAVAAAAATSTVAAVPRPVYEAQSDCNAVQALANVFTPTAAEAAARKPFTVLLLKGLPLKKKTKLDYTQRAAVASALSQELAIVRGAPGTGKTFIGCMLAKVRVVITSMCMLFDCSTYPVSRLHDEAVARVVHYLCLLCALSVFVLRLLCIIEQLLTLYIRARATAYGTVIVITTA
jgi:hypothetical protein